MKMTLNFSDGTGITVVKHDKEARTVTITGECRIESTAEGVLVTFVGSDEKNYTPKSLPEAIYALEKELITRALEATGNNMTQAARNLKTDRKTLRMKIRRYGIW